MAGFFYYMAMIAAGGPLYNAEAPLDIYISMLCHGTIYFCGFVLLAAERFSCRERGKLLLGVGLIAARAALLRPLAARQGRQLIYILLDAAAVDVEHRRARPGEAEQSAARQALEELNK